MQLRNISTIKQFHRETIQQRSVSYSAASAFSIPFDLTTVRLNSFLKQFSSAASAFQQRSVSFLSTSPLPIR
jgi:hypothetical protein